MERILECLSTDEKIIRIISGNELKEISPAELKKKALLILGNLNYNDIKKGDKLIIQYKDNEIYNLLCVFWACVLGGIIPIFISESGTNSAKLKNICRFVSEAKVLYIDNIGNYIDIERQIKLEDILSTGKGGRMSKIDIKDTMFIQFSSGTTGNPKGAIITFQNLLANLEGMRIGGEFDSEDSFISWMPLCHDMGLIGFHLLPLYLGVRHTIISTSTFIRNPIILLEQASQSKATTINATNFSLKFIIRVLERRKKICKFDLKSVKRVVIGAEPINVDIVQSFFEQLETFGLNRNAAFPAYGLAEATLAVAFPKLGSGCKYNSLDKRKLFLKDAIIKQKSNFQQKVICEGKKLFNIDIKITDEEGKTLSDGVVGYINIKGDSVINNYYKNISSESFKDGWFNTRDLGFIEDGNLYVLGRGSDVIYVNGKKYFSHELEELCEKYMKVEGKIAICGVSNKETGTSEIVCFYENKGKRLNEEKMENLVRWLKEENNIYLNKFVEVPKIYKTTSGKISRYKLIEEYESNIEIKLINKSLKESFAYVLEKNIDEDEDFFLNGGDSVGVLILVELIKEKLNITINPESIYKFSSINKLAEYLMNR